MKDPIERQAAIEALDTGLWGVEWDKALATAMLKDLPSAQPGWIPLAVKYPETNEDVLLQFPSNQGVGFYENGSWGINTGDGIYSAIGDGEEMPMAWMPLPKPWEGEHYED